MGDFARTALLHPGPRNSFVSRSKPQWPLAAFPAILYEMAPRQTLCELPTFLVRLREFHATMLTPCAASPDEILDALGLQTGEDVAGAVGDLARQAGEAETEQLAGMREWLDNLERKIG